MKLAGGNKLAIYMCGRRFEFRLNEKKSLQWPEQNLNQEPPDCKSDSLATWPHCLVHAIYLDCGYKSVLLQHLEALGA